MKTFKEYVTENFKGNLEVNEGKEVKIGSKVKYSKGDADRMWDEVSLTTESKEEILFTMPHDEDFPCTLEIKKGGKTIGKSYEVDYEAIADFGKALTLVK